MSGICSVSPKSGCTDSQSLTALQSYTEMLTLKLGELVVKKGQIVTEITNCQENINDKWQIDLDLFEEYKDNREECCDTLKDKFDEIIQALEVIAHVEAPICTTTTEEPVGTTTEAPIGTTTESPIGTTTESPVSTTTETPTPTTTEAPLSPVTLGCCSSSPLSECTETQSTTFISTYTQTIVLKLGQIIVKKGQIVTDVNNCNSSIGAWWQEIIDKFVTYKENRAECCERLADLLDDINVTLEDKTHQHPVTPTTTEEPIGTTTEEPIVTTTEEPVVTTTEGDIYNSRLFNYDDDSDFLCLEENTMTLYYSGGLGVGTVLYTDEGFTPFNLGDYVKLDGNIIKYAVNGFGVITSIVGLCE